MVSSIDHSRSTPVSGRLGSRANSVSASVSQIVSFADLRVCSSFYSDLLHRLANAGGETAACAGLGSELRFYLECFGLTFGDHGRWEVKSTCLLIQLAQKAHR